MSPRPDLTTCARLLLGVGGLALVVVALGPFQWLEFALVPWDKAAHFIAFYGVTSLLFLAFPRRRRVDLAFMATLAGASIEMAQLLCGRDAELGDILADGCGAFAVVVPGYLEIARQAMRADGQRRRERRRRTFGAPARARAAAPAEPVVELV